MTKTAAALEDDHSNAALLMCRRLAEKHLGKPLLIRTFGGLAYEPVTPVAPGDPVIELFAQSGGVLAVSWLRHSSAPATAVAFFPAPFGERDFGILDAWVLAALHCMRLPGPAVA